MTKSLLILCLVVGLSGCASVERIPIYVDKNENITWLELPKNNDIKHLYIKATKDDDKTWELFLEN